MDTMSKVSKVSFVLMIDDAAIEENVSVDFSTNPHRTKGSFHHCPTWVCATSYDTFHVAQIVKQSNEHYHLVK